jgi:hypothetical protein
MILQRQERRETGVLPQGLPLDLMPTEGNLEAQITESDASCSFSGEPLRQDACSNDPTTFDQSMVPGPSVGCSSSIQSDPPVQGNTPIWGPQQHASLDHAAPPIQQEHVCAGLSTSPEVDSTKQAFVSASLGSTSGFHSCLETPVIGSVAQEPTDGIAIVSNPGLHWSVASVSAVLWFFAVL